ncbi:peptidoglycan-binding protein [Clostridia bacterium]|nr:peptidoglycan-binding protein [Clostridia bacterium]
MQYRILQNTDRGGLKIDTYAGTVARPVDNARVTVRPRGDSQKILEELVTDSSGQSPEIELAAPPVEYSMEPAEPMPYSEYDLDVTADGFEPVHIEGVQILPDSTAIQPVYLKPIAGRNERETIQIPRHVLWGEYPPKTPEEEVKPLPPAENFVVLPNPVIPETIIVHAGAPANSSAPNYYVPFKDYIKNVASCEIYATWPESTLTANILAIVSFTLNRVYTEWYRGKGYPFTITNSTAYDHAFQYGRNIFEQISRVVDDVFSMYITRPNIRQPLLAQYCDGRKVSCPQWMTQWGSKSLGDQGWPAINILKNFYGWDIFLMNATRVEGVPQSFTGSLQLGSSGTAVRTIQEQLNAVSKNYPLIPKLKADGIFGANTLSAVKTFQNVFNLPSTGIVNSATWYKISDIYVAVTRLGELK